MASCYYIYYRVKPEMVALARETLQAMLARIEALTAVRGRRLCKTGEPLLWMEVYENVADEASFERALDNEVKASRFARNLAPGTVRKVERFEACA